MAIRYFGNDPVDATDNGAQATIIDLVVSAPIRGMLKRTEVYVGSGTSGNKIKVFRDDGTYYVFVGESGPYSFTAGLNIIFTWIPVEKGDLLAIYTDSAVSGSNPDLTAHVGGSVYKTEDVTTTTLKSGWAGLDYKWSMRGTIFSRVGIL